MFALRPGSWLPNFPGRTVQLAGGTGDWETSTSPVSMSMKPWWMLSYEKPVCTGWSMYSMLETPFQLHGFGTVLLESGCTMHGPLWPDTACTVLPRPGPPCSQRVRGAVWGLLRASKNQKKRLAS